MPDSWERFKISTALLSIHNIVIINLFRQVFNVSVRSAHRKIFLIAYMLQFFFNCGYCGSTSLPTRIIKPFTHWAFTFSKSTIKTLEQGVKSVQSLQKRHQNDIN